MIDQSKDRRNLEEKTRDFLYELVEHFPHNIGEIGLHIGHTAVGDKDGEKKINFIIEVQKKDGNDEAVPNFITGLVGLFRDNDLFKDNDNDKIEGTTIKLTLPVNEETVDKLKEMRRVNFLAKHHGWQDYIEINRTNPPKGRKT